MTALRERKLKKMLKPGAILKIFIKNFVTYNEVEMEPGTNLNIVIGPNGTGKSTILAAIILGLGGTPKAIGRATKVSEFVRHNCSESQITITLQGESDDVTHKITRVFNTRNHSTWCLNDKSSTEQEIKTIVSKLNIQVDNLCQFLPQDRVQDFAKMNKKELLINTEKAVGRSDLVDKHNELITLREEHKTLTSDIELLTKKLEQAEADVARLEGKVKNLNKKKKLLRQIDEIRRKIAWINYDNLLAEKRDAENDLKLAEKAVNLLKKKMQPVETQIESHRRSIGELQGKLNRAKENAKQCENKAKNYLDKIENKGQLRREIIIETNKKLQALTDYQKEVDTMNAKIDKLDNDLNSLITKFGPEAAMNENATKLLRQSDKYAQEAEEANRQRIIALNSLRQINDQLQTIESRLSNMENVRLQRLQILKRRDPDAYEAVVWLNDNRDLFHGAVYEPMIIAMNVIDPAHSKYLENIIPWRDRVAFTCELREDMNLLLQKLRDEKNIRINALHSGAEHPALASYKPQIPIEQLRQYGFFACTNSLITGPEAIIKYLCRMYRIHNIPIGDKSSYKKASQVPKQIRIFFTDSHRFSVSVSRYTGERSTRMNEIESDGTFSVCIDYNTLNQLKRERVRLQNDREKIQTNVNEFESKRQALETKRSQIVIERQNLIQNKEQIRLIEERLETARRALVVHQSGHKTADEIKRETKEKIKENANNSVQLQETVMTLLQDCAEEYGKTEIISGQITRSRGQITNLENQEIDLRNAYEEKKDTYNKVNAVYNRFVQDAKEAMLSAKKLSNGFAPEEPGFGEFLPKHTALPNDSTELESMIHELQTSVECILTADDGELQSYEKNQQLIVTCRDEMSRNERKTGTLDNRMVTVKSEWLDPLEELVSQINRNFGDYFEAMGCAGEVSVSKESGEEEFADYGLCIRVTYRSDEPLQELNRFVQSGGERAVATAVYMLSMQDLTAAPFRCVDEINQGMDPQNERRIFEILVKATAKQGTCQYFLITPKLITSLKFGDAMRVHIVHNGPFCEVGKSCNLSTYISD